jgi:hypothetical protein
MKRSIYQYRPKGDPEGMPYAPQRDLAYVYTPMLREVFAGLDRENWSDYFREWLEAEGITEEDLGDGVKCFVEAHRMFIRDRSVSSPEEAFEKSGFIDLPHPARIMLFERIGEVVMGGWFIALRDVTMHGQMSPQAPDIAEFIAAGRMLAHRLSGHSPREEDEQEGRLELAEAEAEEVERALYQSRDTIRDLTNRLNTTKAVYDHVHKIRNAGLWKRLGGAVWIALKLIVKAAV